MICLSHQKSLCKHRQSVYRDTPPCYNMTVALHSIAITHLIGNDGYGMCTCIFLKFIINLILCMEKNNNFNSEKCVLFW